MVEPGDSSVGAVDLGRVEAISASGARLAGRHRRGRRARTVSGQGGGRSTCSTRSASAGPDLRQGDQVLAAVDRFGPDLVLLDVMLPHRDEFEVCQQLRGAGHDTVKIVMLTAKGRESEVSKGLAVGADAYVTKPFSTRELVAEVARLLEDG